MIAIDIGRWDLPTPGGNSNASKALGYTYDYNRYGEVNTGRPDFADSLYDSTLDRAWTHDHVGRLRLAYTGTEANVIWGSPDGPYAQGYNYDVWGNITSRYGWGGWNAEESASYVNNRRVGMQYDAAGNVLSDNYSTFTYDAKGQPATSLYVGSISLQMAYDGDGLRGKRVENGNTTYYLRSSVLGGQVVCELNSSGGWTRGYVYLGGQMLAMQAGGVFWIHQEPYSKGQRLTDTNGNVTATIELDPWGGDTNRTMNGYLQPRKFTTYDRDANYWDEAQARQYHGWWSRFAQPDPYDGSYSLTNPQSFNRYAYVQNDPVNFVDPSGLHLENPTGNSRPKPLDGNGIFSPGIHVGFSMTDNGRVTGLGGPGVIDGTYHITLVSYYSFVGGVFGSSGGATGGDVAGGPQNPAPVNPFPPPPPGCEEQLARMFW